MACVVIGLLRAVRKGILDMTASLKVRNGIWQMVFSYKGEDGGWKQKSISTGLTEKGNKRRAEQMMSKKLRELETVAATELDNQDTMFLDAMWEWLCDVMVTKVRPNTLGEYKRAFNYNIKTYKPFQGLPLQKLTPAILQKFYNTKGKAQLSQNSLLKLHVNINKFLKYAKELGVIPSNPASHVVAPTKTKSKVAKFCTAEQLQSVMNIFRDDPLELTVYLTASLGLRRSEVCGLRWSAVDLEHRKLLICHTAINCDGVIAYVDATKSESSQRVMALSEKVCERLRKAKDDQAYWAKMMGQDYHHSGYVCTREDGTPIHPDFVSHHFPRVLKAHGMEHIRFHDLRHSAASMLHEQGFDIRDIQDFLGHSDIKTTAIYTHLKNTRMVEMANSVGDLLPA